MHCKKMSMAFLPIAEKFDLIKSKLCKPHGIQNLCAYISMTIFSIKPLFQKLGRHPKTVLLGIVKMLPIAAVQEGENLGTREDP